MVTVETLIERMQIIYPNIKIAEELTVLGFPCYSTAVAAGLTKSYRDTGYDGFEVSYIGKVTFPWCGSIWEAEGTPARKVPNMITVPSAINFKILCSI